MDSIEKQGSFFTGGRANPLQQIVKETPLFTEGNLKHRRTTPIDVSYTLRGVAHMGRRIAKQRIISLLLPSDTP